MTVEDIDSSGWQPTLTRASFGSIAMMFSLEHSGPSTSRASSASSGPRGREGRSRVSSEIVPVSEYIDRMEDVISCFTQGITSPTLISKELGIPRSAVQNLITQWKAIVANSNEIKSRAKESVVVAIEQYDRLINESWETVRQVNDEIEVNGPDAKFMSQKAVALKNIADFEYKRFSMLKDMGAMDDATVAAEYAEIERKNQMVMDILREVVMDCDHCKMEVLSRIGQITGETYPIKVTRVDG